MSEERTSQPNRPPDAPTVVTGAPRDWPTQTVSVWGRGRRQDDPSWAADHVAEAEAEPAEQTDPGRRGGGQGSAWGRRNPPTGAAWAAGGLGAGAAPAPPANRPAPRRARIALKRVDPWSVLKVTFIYSLALLVIILVAVTVLYGVLSAMGVFRSIDSFLSTVGASGKVSTYVSLKTVDSYSAIFGLVNVVLFTALSTIGAFLYNLCSELVGGVELTLTETQ